MTRTAPLILILALNTAFAAPDDETKEQQAALKEQKAELVKADRALNAAWAAVKETMGKVPDSKEWLALKADQRKWAQDRDEIAPLPTGKPGTGGSDASRRDYETATWLTEWRTPWLRGLSNPFDEKDLTGSWVDDRAGELRVVQEGGNLYFSIHVVRGRNEHEGDLNCVVSWNSPKGSFSSKSVDEEKNPIDTSVSFLLQNRILQIRSVNDQVFGSGTIQGNYVRVAALSAKEKADVVEEAKKGPQHAEQ